MLEEQVGHHVDHIPRRVQSPAVGAPMPVAGPPTSRIMESQRQTMSPAQHTGQLYRPHIDEVLNQLQSQLHVHSEILEEQRHKLDRLDHAVTRLQQDQNLVFNTVRDIQNHVASKLSAKGDAPDATEIDIFMEQLRNVTVKVNEVEGLKLELNIMRRQMRRLERHASPVPSAQPSEPPVPDHAHPDHTHPASQPHAHHVHASFPTSTPTASAEPRPGSFQTPQENRLPPPILSGPESRDVHAPTEGRTLPGFRSIDPAATSAVSGWRPAGGFPPGLAPPAGPSTATPQAEAPPVSAWAAVNAAPPKRAVPIDGQPTGYEGGAPGSPKRQRLAPLMPRMNYGEPGYEGGPEVGPNQLPHVPSLANSRQESNESAGSSLPPPPPNPLRFVLSTQDAPSAEDTWRAAESHRALAEGGRGGRASPRRGRGGGRGRGVRKSGSGEERGTPEWEQPADWAGGSVGTNGGFYPPGLHHQDSTSSRGSLVRRGGGHMGGTPDHPSMGVGATPQIVEAHQRQQHAQHMPHASLYPDAHFMPINTAADVAAAASNMTGAGGHSNNSNPNTPSQSASTKKTRTKPIRNADGVLIRKDGRPDMRSVSSAMNLKKVHAKKEAERHSKDASEDGGNARDTKSSGGGGANDTPRSGNNDPASPNDDTPSRGRTMRGAEQGHDHNDYASSDDEMDDEEASADEAAASDSDGNRHYRAARELSAYAKDFPETRNTAPLPPPDVKIEADAAEPDPVTVTANASTSTGVLDGNRAVPSRESANAVAVGAGEKVAAGDVGVGPAVPPLDNHPAADVRPSMLAATSLPTPVPSTKPDALVEQQAGAAADEDGSAAVTTQALETGTGMAEDGQDIEMGEASVATA